MKQTQRWKWRPGDPRRASVAWFPTAQVFADSEVRCSTGIETHDHYGRPIEEHLQRFVSLQETHEVKSAPCPLCKKPMDLTRADRLGEIMSGSPDWRLIPAHADCVKAMRKDASPSTEGRKRQKTRRLKRRGKNRRRRG